MRYFIRFIELILLLLLVGITIQNSHPVEFKLFAGQSWNAPLIVFLLIFFILGAIVGLITTFGYYIRSRRELAHLKKELRQRPLATPVTEPKDALVD